MALEIKVTPTLEDSGNGLPTTKLEIIVDLTSILGLLKKYDLLLKTTLEVKTSSLESGSVEVDRYEYANVYKNIQEESIRVEMIVLGYIVDESDIHGKAQGIFINK